MPCFKTIRALKLITDSYRIQLQKQNKLKTIKALKLTTANQYMAQFRSYSDTEAQINFLVSKAHILNDLIDQEPQKRQSLRS